MIVYLDTNIAIYAVEDPLLWGAKALAKLTALRDGGDTFMVSDLTRMECRSAAGFISLQAHS